jgi:hypothetical protein
MANTKCGSSAPTGAVSKRSARKAWFPQLSAATAQLVDQIKVDHYKPAIYAEGCYVAGLKKEYMGKLEERWDELARAALTTYGPQALDCDDYGRPIRPRHSKRATVKSQSYPWYKRVPSLLPEHCANPGSAYTIFSQMGAASLAIFKSTSTGRPTTDDGLPERIEDDLPGPRRDWVIS